MLETLSRYPAGTPDPIDRYIRPNINTQFGRAHDFANIHSYAEFKQAIPLQSYADLEPYITRASDGEANVLTAEKPLAFELTSGTSNASRLIPITPSFQSELAAALNLWMGSWQKRIPAVFDGQTQGLNAILVTRDVGRTAFDFAADRV